MRTHRIIDVISFTKQDSDRAISEEIYVITRSPRKEITRKGAFFGATIMEQQRQQKKTKTLETTFYSPSKAIPIKCFVFHRPPSCEGGSVEKKKKK